MDNYGRGNSLLAMSYLTLIDAKSAFFNSQITMSKDGHGKDVGILEKGQILYCNKQETSNEIAETSQIRLRSGQHMI